MQLEIAPQHHLFIIGRAGANVKQIMQHTGAAIHFPDPSGGLVNSALQTSSAPPPAQRKSSVIVSGPIDGVCLARQHLIVSTSITIAASASFMCLRIQYVVALSLWNRCLVVLLVQRLLRIR